MLFCNPGILLILHVLIVNLTVVVTIGRSKSSKAILSEASQIFDTPETPGEVTDLEPLIK
jgi:hypothetical protein